MVSKIVGGGTALVVNVIYAPCPNDPSASHIVLDKTWQEIYDAVSAGQPAIFIYTDADSSGSVLEFNPLMNMGWSEPNQLYGLTLFNFRGPNSSTEFVTDSANGYPSTDCSIE